MSNKRSGWIQTYTGQPFELQFPKQETINIRDIARALAFQCRFNGHANRYYSIAQHSVLVCELLPNEHKRAGLLHDAAEAYIGDLVRPLKVLQDLRRYKEIEELILFAIFQKFEIEYPIPEIVSRADNVMLNTEKRDLMGPVPEGFDWEDLPEPRKSTIEPVGPIEAERIFLFKFSELWPDQQINISDLPMPVNFIIEKFSQDKR